MQPCEELRNLVLKNYENEALGRVHEVVTDSYSHQEGTTVIGSDPANWFEGYEAIFKFYEPAATSRLEVTVEVLHAFREGNIGWTMDRVRLKLPDGGELPIRHTRIFEREAEGWKIVHNHTSIPVPDEKLYDLWG